MRLSELKDSIINNTLGDSLLIFIWEDNKFLASQYIHEIAKKRSQEIQFVDSFDELVGISANENVFGDDFGDNVLKVLDTDTFDELASEGMASIANSIIMCHKLAKEVAYSYESFPNLTINFAKEEPWQAKEYISAMCKGLSNESISRLYDLTNGDIFRIDNEIGKINCFPIEEQERVLSDMVSNGAFDDLAQTNIFNLTNAIVKKDLLTIGRILRNIKNMDVDAIGLSAILHKNIKNIIDIQMNSKATPESLGMSAKQFRAIEYSCGKISNPKLIELLKFLDELDFKLKSGALDLPNEDKIDYIVCKMLER